MKPGCMEIKYDILSVSAKERAGFEDGIKKVAVVYGFELLSLGGSVEHQRDMLFVKNVKVTKRETNKDEHAATPPPVKKE